MNFTHFIYQPNARHNYDNKYSIREIIWKKNVYFL